MPLEIVTIPCRSDNYAYLLRDEATGATGLVDAPEAGPLAAELERRGWGLDVLLITHHHGDHVEGVEALRERFKPQVIGAEADRKRLPRLDRAVAEGDEIAIGASGARVLDASGHTVGHVAFHFPEAAALFSADSLMVMGCGRIFEGTAEMMWATLVKLAGLPAETRIYSGHEYTEANLRFALSLGEVRAPGEDPAPGEDRALAERAGEIRALRAAGRPTVPATLAAERATNPFLRAGSPDMKELVGMRDAPDAEVFAEIRRRKDAF